jgi:hypothetical protein
MFQELELWQHFFVTNYMQKMLFFQQDFSIFPVCYSTVLKSKCIAPIGFYCLIFTCRIRKGVVLYIHLLYHYSISFIEGFTTGYFL